MKRNGIILSAIVLALGLGTGGVALGQSDIDFGDDTSTWANDGECDDPRFSGEGAATVTLPADEMHDATDCRTAFEAGTIQLAQDAPQTEAEPTPPAAETPPSPDAGETAPRPETAPAEAPAPDEETALDFGDDSGVWANDGECDDPRFVGEGMGVPDEGHRMADAADCRAAYEAGSVTLMDAAAQDVDAQDIDFGDDSSVWANDGECDDGRFAGEGMGLTGPNHIRADATDCREAFEAGTITFVGEVRAPDESGPATAVNFGDDSGIWANDGECDDPRFVGEGMGVADEDHRGADASDCQAAYEAGTVTLREEASGEPIVIDGIDFGDDSGQWSNDGECDDARFEGQGVGISDQAHVMADATDCSTAYRAGTVSLASGNGSTGGDANGDFVINFGDDSGTAANDGVCDDPRFQGPGGASRLFEQNRLRDASDCSAAYDAGTVSFDPQ